jgi:hypothetical protein
LVTHPLLVQWETTKFLRKMRGQYERGSDRLECLGEPTRSGKLLRFRSSFEITAQSRMKIDFPQTGIWPNFAVEGSQTLK